jgi:DNA-3-methyladenine glycosylase II
MNEVTKGIEHIRRNDPVLAKIIKEKSPFNLKPSDEYFKDLVSTIISQQLSFKVYRTLEKRLFDKLNHNFSPKEVLALPDEDFRKCGLSVSKGKYIKNVAEFFIQNPGFDKSIKKLSDEEITAKLISIKGIGNWSVQMFLIFNLVRLDVFPMKDLGIRNAIRKLYNFKKEPTEKQMLKVAAKWGSYKTIATWYLWRYLENQK